MRNSSSATARCSRKDMLKISAGLLMFRRTNGKLQVFLVHPGGPFWSGKEDAAWSIPKGLVNPDEAPFAAAQREFEEETGFTSSGPFMPLNPVKQPGGKVVQAWAFEGAGNPSTIKSNYFSMEWPPRSGQLQKFPEVDRADWFDIEEAKIKIHKGQVPLLEELQKKLRISLS